MSVEIQRDVPLPPPKSGPGRPSVYPWTAMQPGASFFVAGDRANVQKRAHSSFKSFRLGRGVAWRIATRSVVEGGVEGVWVWRVEE